MLSVDDVRFSSCVVVVVDSCCETSIASFSLLCNEDSRLYITF